MRDRESKEERLEYVRKYKAERERNSESKEERLEYIREYKKQKEEEEGNISNEGYIKKLEIIKEKIKFLKTLTSKKYEGYDRKKLIEDLETIHTNTLNRIV